ncbi:MAG: DNA-directed DNA polymerase II small subunit [Thermoplasmata archaeon]|uniref:DNA polymerase II small subunit n=1 Tax=Candidatus Sysuiplasma superficiale TaxID=2823368 RepID=A0A8J7YT90_9ARCH|nr:DNA-directed DNA polymerase II small subunit [Candidatus Sysuiplasma superficiale]MBX8643547.1 DNA-directed DNA polymerase II small subunit [Candidatus Sysuiplasma superficiale]
MNSSIESLLKIAAEKGVLLEPDALRELSRENDAVLKLSSLIERSETPPLVITATMLSATDHPGDGIRGAGQTVGHISSVPSPPRVLKDISGNSTATGNVRDFSRYFTDRFRSIKKILLRRADMAGAIPISKVLHWDRDARIIGIVNSVRVTKNGHRLLEIEDEEERCTVLLMKEKGFDTVLKDEVIGVHGRMSRDKHMMVAQTIVRPDVPFNRDIESTDTSSRVAILSDTHIGSKTFLRKEWDDLLKWLKTSPEARDINYIIVSGDLADGIGVYPDQEDDLEISDVYGQYERVSQYFAELPDWTRIILMPGNHDAVRPAEPQPTFHGDIRKMFGSEVTFVGNPSTLDIEGRRVLSYHGRSFDDVISSIPGLTWEKPIEAMVELLRRRHLAPIYGEKTPLAPEHRDYLVIEEVPDIFITGHIHSYGLSDYRGVRLVSGSTWQSQTSYQKMKNITPVPAKMPVVDLADLSMNVVNFSNRYTSERKLVKE